MAINQRQELIDRLVQLGADREMPFQLLSSTGKDLALDQYMYHIALEPGEELDRYVSRLLEVEYEPWSRDTRLASILWRPSRIINLEIDASNPYRATFQTLPGLPRRQVTGNHMPHILVRAWLTFMHDLMRLRVVDMEER